MDTTDEPSFNDALAFLRRGLPFALIVALIAAALTYVASERERPSYRTSATVLVSQTNPNLGRFDLSAVTAPPIDPSAYASIALLDPVLEAAAEEVGPEFWEVGLATRLEDLRISGFVTVVAEGSDPVLAAEASNAVAGALVSWDQQRAASNLAQIVSTLEQQVAALEGSVAGGPPSNALEEQLRERRGQLDFARSLPASSVGLVEIVERAAVPVRPFAPRSGTRAALGFVIGLLAAYGLLQLREALGTRVRSPESLGRLTGLPVLADVSGNERSARDGVVYLRNNLDALAATSSAPAEVVVFVTPRDLIDASLVAFHTALSFSASGRRALLVDANLRSSALFEWSRGRDDIAVSSLQAHLQGDVDLAGLRAGDPLPVVIPPKRTPPAPEALELGLMSVMKPWEEACDVMVFDTTPLLEGPDALWLVRRATRVVLVVSPRRTPRTDIARTLELLEQMRAPVAGIVTTDASLRRPKVARSAHAGSLAPEPRPG